MGALLEGIQLAVIGGDDREIYLIPELQKQGAKVIGLGLEKSPLGDRIEHASSLEEVVKNADAFLFPMFGADERGLVKAKYSNNPIVLNQEFLEVLTENVPIFIGFARPPLRAQAQALNIPLIEVANRNDVAILNSIPSAEGAIQMAMEATNITIHSSESFVLGIGRTGLTLVNLLKGMGANVTAVARKPEDLARAVEMGVTPVAFSQLKREIRKAEIVFNTVPSTVLSQDVLDLMRKDAAIIDLASIPGGTDFEHAQKIGLKAQLAPGLPGIVAPKTAGRMLAKIYPSLILQHLPPRLKWSIEGGASGEI